METLITKDHEVGFLTAFKKLQMLRHFDGDTKEFWSRYVEMLNDLCSSHAGIIANRDGNGGWKLLAAHTGDTGTPRMHNALTTVMSRAADECAKSGIVHLYAGDASVLGVNVLAEADIRNCIALFYLDRISDEVARTRLEALNASNDIPADFRVRKSAMQALKKQSRLSDILELSSQLNEQRKFLPAGMLLVNEFSSRYFCDRVSLGWFQKGYVRVKAISHTDNFEKKMDSVQQLELAMEEALDQDAEIVLPAPESAPFVTRDHTLYAKAQDIKFLATFPLRRSQEVLGLVTLERNSEPFDEAELRHIRIALDQLTHRLYDLRQRDRWFGAVWADWIREKSAAVLGYQHTWAKIGALAGAGGLMAIGFIPVQYRVTSPMILKTDDLSYITAPFDGYIDSVHVKPGDQVSDRQTLLSLDTEDLLLQEAGFLAEKNRERREIEKSRASAELAEMRIAQARHDQVDAKLATTRYKISQAAIRSPIEGVIVEGDLTEKIGSPVQQGEVLFKVGRITNIYAQAKVKESEIQYIDSGAVAEIALTGRPHDKRKTTVRLIVPSAVSSDKDNVFHVRCMLIGRVPEWFRPGMTGISKINAGRRTILWIISHQTIDFLRLKLWW